MSKDKEKTFHKTNIITIQSKAGKSNLTNKMQGGKSE